MIVIAKSNDIDVVLATFAYSDGTPDSFVTFPSFKKAINEYNELIKSISKSTRVYFYDFASEMPTAKKYWSDDGYHVNAEGAKKKGKLFADFILSMWIIPDHYQD